MSDWLASVIAGCLQGEAWAARALVERYYRMVFSVCLRMLGRREDAEDTVQETFVRALRSLASYDPSRRFEPWLLTIAMNRCRTLLASRRRESTVELCWESLPDARPEGPATDQLREEIERALDKMRPEYREAFLMFHQLEMSYADIAEALGRPINTIKTWIHRARRQIVTELQQRNVVSCTRKTP
ncbi:MAG: DNA-directed RNA polymerase sigma-70 factor [Pirellulaceae bacterium]|nr:MAG: DNA-directed RNA polymerase sigma-70 factor [Pirellulaceae bacterium]